MKKRSFFHKTQLVWIICFPMFLWIAVWPSIHEHKMDLHRSSQINQAEVELRGLAEGAAMLGIGFLSVVAAAFYDVKTIK